MKRDPTAAHDLSGKLVVCAIVALIFSLAAVLALVLALRFDSLWGFVLFPAMLPVGLMAAAIGFKLRASGKQSDSD